MFANDLQYIRVSSDRAVLKRGTSELMLSGEGVHKTLETLIGMLDGNYSRTQIVAGFPSEQHEEIEELLTGLLRRRLITESPEPETEASLDALQARFWRNFGDSAEIRGRLGQARCVVVGANLITRALLRSLLEIGVGGITLVDHAVLNNELASVLPMMGADERISRVPALPSGDEFNTASVLCAASDFGAPDALLEMNRVALRAHKPFLPVWLSDLIGHIGPLTYPGESACLRCYRARLESNNPNWAATRAVQLYTSQSPHIAGAGLLPPMASILGEIAATEIVCFIAGFPPPDTVGRIIEINLVSWASTVRRVLKIPRCPDCSEMMRKASRAITLGPLIPYEAE